MNKPNLSVIVVTANQKNQLKLCLQSLVNQKTKFSFEVHVCDDGQEDCFDVISEFKDKLDVTYHILFPRSTKWRLSANRNMGLRFIKAERVLFIDSDTILEDNVIEEHAKYGNENIVLGGWRKHILEEDVSKIKEVNLSQIREIATPATKKCNNWDLIDKANDNLINDLKEIKDPLPKWVYGFQVSYPTKIIYKLGGYSEQFKKWGWEEAELNERLEKKDMKFLIKLDLVSYHLDHELQIKKNLERLEGEKIKNELQENNITIANNTPIYQLNNPKNNTIKLDLFDEENINAALKEIEKYPSYLVINNQEKYFDYDKDWEGIISIKT